MSSQQRIVSSEELDVLSFDSENELNVSNLKMVTINLGTYSDKRKAKVSVRREGVRKNVIEITPKYDLIFAQEIPAPKREAKLLNLDERGYGSMTPIKDAGIFWSKERLTYIDTIANDPYFKQHAREFVRKDDRGSELNSRSTCAVFEVSIKNKRKTFERQTYNLLAISWHGPHKTRRIDKIEIFKLLQQYANKLTVLVKERNGIDIDEIIIGGDFNINLANLGGALEDGFKMAISIDSQMNSDKSKYTGEQKEKVIDGYVYKSSINTLFDVQKIEGCTGLDHSPFTVTSKVVKLDVIVTEPEE